MCGKQFNILPNLIQTFAWDPGTRTNNQVDDGFNASNRNTGRVKYWNLPSFGDSQIVIKNMQDIYASKGKEVGRVQKRILAFIPDITKVKFFHVK